MHKLYILLLASLFTNISVSLASNTVDSIGVENNKGKKVIIYKVEPKETYYSIAKKYNVPYKEVMEFNDSQLLQIGVTVKIPTSVPFTSTPSNKTAPTGDFIEYTIKAKDNLNLLATKYETTVDEIKRINQLNSINLQIGQVLKIPTGKQITTENTPPVVYKKVEKPAVPVVETVNSSENTSGTTITYTIKAKDNLNALAEKYGTTVEAIKKLNNLRSINLKIGQVLKIAASNGETGDVPQETVAQPVVTSKPVVNTPTTTTIKSESGFEHTVVSGETIYSIAKRYNLTTYQLKTANNLTDNELSLGQKLIIKGANKTVANTAPEEEANSGETLKDPKLRQPASKFGLVRFDEKGPAIWIEDQDLDPTKMLVLHRTAPIGTIIRITNPVTNRSAFAKVVGKFTENESTKDVIIVMTKAVADAIGALDKRFFCNLNYGAVENEQQ